MDLGRRRVQRDDFRGRALDTRFDVAQHPDRALNLVALRRGRRLDFAGEVVHLARSKSYAIGRLANLRQGVVDAAELLHLRFGTVRNVRHRTRHLFGGERNLLGDGGEVVRGRGDVLRCLCGHGDDARE